VDVYKTEEEQVEAIKKWWQENGKSIIAGVVIGITAIFGWRAYDSHMAVQSEQASVLYEQMIVAARTNDDENVLVYANRIIGDYKSSTYAVFASLMLAKVAAEAGEFEQAETHLRWVLKNSSQVEFEHIARLRLARILIASDKLELATETLNVNKPGDFVARYEELRGDIYVKQGKPDEAIKAYEKSLANTKGSSDAQSVLQMKLDDLGRS
jgi:predicted negative regulator of RcsB-dependent stress response